MIFDLIAHDDEVLEALDLAKDAALEAIGAKAAGYAFMLAPADTGRLRNSLTWATKKTEGRSFSYADDNGVRYSYEIGNGVDKDSVYVGTNVEYAVYQEMGTSKIDAQPYLKPAVENHREEYVKIARRFLKGES